jgi:hypothetical protein
MEVTDLRETLPAGLWVKIKWTGETAEVRNSAQFDISYIEYKRAEIKHGSMVRHSMSPLSSFG